MIVIDMPIPKKCIDCPCSYWIQSGEWEGMLMCNVMEYNLHRKGAKVNTTKMSLVDEYIENRPKSCPILGKIDGITMSKGD